MTQQHQFVVPKSLAITWLPKEQYFICWKPHTSCLRSDRSSVLKFARWPASTPTGQRLREWLDEVLGTTKQQEPIDADPTAHTRVII